MISPLRPSSHRRAATLLIGALAIAACSGGSDAAPDPIPAPLADGDGAAANADAIADEPAAEAPTDTSDAAAGDEPNADDVGAAMSVASNPANVLSAVVTITTTRPVAAQLTARSGDHVVEVPRTASAGTDVVIPLVGLRRDRTYELSAQLFADGDRDAGTVTGSFTSGQIPERFADYEFSADPERSSPGYTIIEMQEWNDPSLVTPQRPFDAPQYLIALDEEGEIVWYYENGFVIGGVEQTPDGTFTSIYFEAGVREFDMLGTELGDWEVPLANLVDPDDPATTTTVAPADETPAAAPTAVNRLDPLPVDSPDVVLKLIHHEATKLPNGNYLALSTTSHPLTPQQRATFCPDDPAPFDAISDVAVEFDSTGQVLRTWDLWDAIDIDEVPGGELCNLFFEVRGDRDWTHANALVYDEGRDAVVFSSRHTNQVIAMKHLDALGPQTEVLWIFGDNGTMPIDGVAPRYQHAVEIEPDGSILLYDNGNGRPGTVRNDPVSPMYSRAVLFDVDDSSPDPADWTVTQRWEHRIDDNGTALFSPIIGDADRLPNGNVLITHGAIGFQDPGGYIHSRVIEVVPDGAAGGDIVWEFDAGSPELFISNYRAERIESFYIGPDWVAAN